VIGLYTKVHSGWLHLTRRIRNEDGAVATEYGLLMVLIALAIVVGATAVGVAINALFNDAAGKLKAPAAPAAG
jgi:pilus assembly protein Flp/PilA